MFEKLPSNWEPFKLLSKFSGLFFEWKTLKTNNLFELMTAPVRKIYVYLFFKSVNGFHYFLFCWWYQFKGQVHVRVMN